jgi:hypothetical protein
MLMRAGYHISRLLLCGTIELRRRKVGVLLKTGKEDEMSTVVNESHVRRWVFRQFKPYVLAGPAFRFIVIAIPVCCLSILYLPFTLYLLLLLLWPGTAFLLKVLDWRARYIEIRVADNGKKKIIFREDIWPQSEKVVYLSDFPVPTYRQDFLGQIFDYGDLSLSFIGGPGEMKMAENFSALRLLIDSLGEKEPEPRRSLFRRAASGIWTAIRFFPVAATWVWRVLYAATRRIAHGLGWIARALLPVCRRFGNLLGQWGSTIGDRLLELLSPPPALPPSYRGLLQFCDYELLGNGRRLDLSHPPDGIPQQCLQIYISILTDARLIVSENGDGGPWVVSPRISSIRDIQQRIDPEGFERFIGRHRVADLRSEPMVS